MIDRSIISNPSNPDRSRRARSRHVASQRGWFLSSGIVAWITLGGGGAIGVSLIHASDQKKKKKEKRSQERSPKTPNIPEGPHEGDAGKTRGNLSNSQADASYGTLQPPGVLCICVTSRRRVFPVVERRIKGRDE